MLKDDTGFEHLHSHSDFSLLDGYGTVEEYAERATKINMDYLCISDHGMMGVIPRQIRACEEHGLSPIFACELYVQDMHPPKDVFEKMSGAEKLALVDGNGLNIRKSYHLLAIAYNKTGYSNLVQLCTWAHLNGYYYRPRVTHEQLLKHKEGIIFTSCCYNSEIGQTFDKMGTDAAMDMVKKYKDMFGDNFYLEIMLLDFQKQLPYDKFILQAHDKFHIPIIVTNDCHYCNQEDSKYQRYMLMIQKETTIQEIEKKLSSEDKMDIFELQDSNLWMKSEIEINQKWREMYSDVIPDDILTQAKLNTVEICRKAKGVEIDRNVKLPQIPDADDKFLDELLAGMNKRGVKNYKKYQERMIEEYKLICRKGFSSYFLIQKQMTDEARRICPKLLGWGNGDEAVGPGRGCLAGDVTIVTSNGFKPISEVTIGDNVITRSGKFSQVLNKMEYDIKEDLLCVKSFYGDSKGVAMTKDHKVLASKCKYSNDNDAWAMSTRLARRSIEEPGELAWFRADELEIGDWVFVPRPETKLNQMISWDLSKFSEGKYDENNVYQDWMNPLTGSLRRRKILPRYLNLDETWFTILGLFTGDGWLRSDGSNRLGFCFHSENNEDGRLLLISKLKEIGVDYRESKNKGKKLIQVHVNSKHLRNLFSYWYNDYKFTSGTKHIPQFVFSQSEENKLAFLKGYLWSDGHIGENKLIFSTTSPMLADQIRMLCWQVGIPSSQTKSVRTDSRTGFKSNPITIRIPKTKSLSGTDGLDVYQYRKTAEGFLSRVREISTVSGIDKVYDLTVDGEHNYLTSSFLVHNSAVGSLACYCLGITDVDPIKHNLLFSRFLSESRGGKSMKLRFGQK